MSDYNPGHATSQPVAEDIVIPEALVFSDPPDWNSEAALNSKEIEHFKQQGFVVKRSLIDLSQAFEQALDHAWSQVPRGILQRDSAQSWLDSPDTKWAEEDVPKVGRLSRGNWKIRSRGDQGIGTEPFLVNDIAANPALIRVVEAFLGQPVMPVRRVRGIYFILPKPVDSVETYGVHADYSAAHLSAMVFIDDVPPHAGGFTLWPGSHIALHPHWNTVHGSHISDDKREGYRHARDQVLRTTQPVEPTGKPGDVIFWHPRIMHSAGINHSAEWPEPMVRSIVPCDFQPAGKDYYDDLSYGPGPDVQYWVDTRNYHGDVAPTIENLWHDWGV